MKIINLTQGSPEWLAYRRTHFNASDAPAMMGCSPYKTRSQLLDEMATGLVPEVDAGTQRRFDNGHRVEALARPLAEEFIGQELYPVVGELGRLSASFDGLTMSESEGFEHKALNDAIRISFKAMGDAVTGVGMSDADGCRLLPLHHRIQMEQQLHISGAERILFMSSQWTSDGDLVEEQHCWYYPDAPLRAEILAGWQQFEADLANYVRPAAVEVVTAAPQAHLPAVSVQVSGSLAVVSNLTLFGTALRAFVAKIPTKPSTDQEFADTDAACKRLKEAEDRLQGAEEQALASMADVNDMRRMVAELSELARTTRLASEKMVTARKEAIRGEIVADARLAWRNHITSLQAELEGVALAVPEPDFAGAIKGKRTVDSLRNAVDTLLAQAKITASDKAAQIRSALAALREVATGFEFLFRDRDALALKPAEDVRLLAQARITEHKAAEARRLEAERERIRAEEQAKAQREAVEAARLAAEQQAARDESERKQREAIAQAERIANAPAPAPVAAPAPVVAAAPAVVAALAVGPAPSTLFHAGVVEAIRHQTASVVTPAPFEEELVALAAEARESRFPSQPKMGPEWWSRFYAVAAMFEREAA